MRSPTKRAGLIRYALPFIGLTALMIAVLIAAPTFTEASSHREAPLISDDPLADNTDLYAFRDPGSTDDVIIVANYIPLELPSGGPNYHQWGENIRYEIHVKNQTSEAPLGRATDDITYRFTFTRVNEDPTTFFKIRLGAENLKATYLMEKSTDGGETFQPVVTNGFVPPVNVGPRSIESGTGLGTTYEALSAQAITTATTGETVFVGPRDDPFFVDLGGAFDLGNFRNEFGDSPAIPSNARDEVAGFNSHSIILRVPISSLQKDGKSVAEAEGILDPNYVIGVWASASRPRVRVLSPDGDKPTVRGEWTQVSRLGMPLTNEVIIPIGRKDEWNATSPYDRREQEYVQYLSNPELALYMGNGAFAAAVPNLSESLEIQTMAYPALGDLNGDGSPGLDFSNGADGLAALRFADIDPTGTAGAVPLEPALAAIGEPRRADLYPIFYFGVPNLIPYQLATGKTAGPLSPGKPFINNFLPITAAPDGKIYGGDMLRLNMATPVTDRDSEEFQNFAYQGLIRAAVLGLVAEPFNTTADLEFIPHMDGFPNGRRLEDDVTTIELQAVAGVVLAAIGLGKDDAVEADYSDLASPQLLEELGFLSGPIANDVPLLDAFPYLAPPQRGYDYVRALTAEGPSADALRMAQTANARGLGLGVPEAFILESNYPNPFNPSTTIEYQVAQGSEVRLDVYDVQGRLVRSLVNERKEPGTYSAQWDASDVASGVYVYRLMVDGRTVMTRKATLVK